MDTSQFEAEKAHQLEIKEQALKATQYTNGLSIHDKKARFPGFRQHRCRYKAGQQLKPGARPFSEDLVMHESVPMQLPDGPTLHSDIFLPARFETLDSKCTDPVPALVAW